MTKMLYILRHAKAEVGTATQDDHTRTLAPRGIEAAQVMAQYMVGQGFQPDKVLCSDAVRTRETWAHIAPFYTAAMEVDYTRKLYLASANEMAGVLAALPETVQSVLLVAHNPSVHQLCLKLAKEGDEDVLDAMHLKFPTCALAVIELEDVAWADIASARGTLRGFITPKMLAGFADD